MGRNLSQHDVNSFQDGRNMSHNFIYSFHHSVKFVLVLTKFFRNGRIMSLCSSYLMSITGEISLAVNQKAGEILLKMI